MLQLCQELRLRELQVTVTETQNNDAHEFGAIAIARDRDDLNPLKDVKNI